MDHFDIIERIKNGSILELTMQTKENHNAMAFLDGDPVSVSQAVRASNSTQVKVSAACREWVAYKSA